MWEEKKKADASNKIIWSKWVMKILELSQKSLDTVFQNLFTWTRRSNCMDGGKEANTDGSMLLLVTGCNNSPYHMYSPWSVGP